MKTIHDLKAVYELPLLELILRAAEVHRAHHDFRDIQRCALLSIKTGSCPEDCAYCPQSAHYATGVAKEKLLDLESVLAAAQQAQASGSTRFCMGAAWRQVDDLGAPATQPDLHLPIGQVQGAQVVSLHQAGEVMDPLDVERLGRSRGDFRHSFTPQSAGA